MGGHCEINIYSRRTCTFCRLAKCFASGMQIELIRCPRTRKNTKRQTRTMMNEMKAIVSNRSAQVRFILVFNAVLSEFKNNK